MELLSDGLKEEEGESLEDKIWNRCFKKISFYDALSEKEKKSKWFHTIKAFKFFDMFNPETKVQLTICRFGTTRRATLRIW